MVYTSSNIFGGMYNSVILFLAIASQYLNISVIEFSSYKNNCAPFNNVTKNSKILTSNPILVDAKHLSLPPIDLKCFVNALTKLFKFLWFILTPLGIPVDPDV